MVKYEGYHEENNVINVREYRRMLHNISQNEESVIGRKSIIRKIYFNTDINYMMETSESDENTDIYSIVMTDFDQHHLLIEKKSNRGGMIYKSYAAISKKQCDRLLDGDLLWMEDEKDAVIESLYLQMTINQIRPGVIVDYTRERYRIHGQDSYIELDTSIKSGSYRKDECLMKELELTERLQKDCVAMTYKQQFQIPTVLLNILAINTRRQLATR